MHLADFDQIVCVCLDKRRDEWRELEKQFEARGAKVTRFVVGKGYELPYMFYSQIDPPVYEMPTTWRREYTYNAYCCHLSHRKIIEQAKRDGLKNILLLEDDCRLLDNFDEVLEKASEQIQSQGIKWDTLSFGTNISWASATQVSPNLIKLHHTAYCFHAIAINQEHNDMFQTFLDLPVTGPFDWLWANYVQPNPKYNCYGVWPNVAVQKPGMSYVNSCQQDYTQWLKGVGNNDIK